MDKKSRIMDDETRRKLLGLLPFAPGASIPFTPAALQNVGQAFRPVFLLRPYEQKERIYLADHLKSGTYDKNAVAVAMENSGVVSWSNFVSLPDGEEIPYGKGILLSLPDVVFYQIHDKISEMTMGPNEIEKEGLA